MTVGLVKHYPNTFEALLSCWPRAFSSPGRVRRFQERSLRRLVDYAYRGVAYYQKAFGDAGVAPADIRTLDDLTRLPITAKSDLQRLAVADRLAANAEEDVVVHETSGSTGERMQIYRRPDEERHLLGRRLRALILSGVRPWDRRIILGATPKQFLPHRLGVFRLAGIPLDVPPATMIDKIERYRPTVLKGPPTTLELLLDDHSERLAALRLRRVFTGAEHLSPGTRARLERTCGSPVIDLYGATECNLIAWQCIDCGAYHTCDDTVIVEVIHGDRPARPGEDGEVVITALHSYLMPFIRYRIGDMVHVPASRPACRIGFGAIEQVQGRAIDYLRFPDGTRLSPYMVMGKLDAIEGIRRYEVRQVSPLRIEVRYELLEGGEGGSIGHRIREECLRLFPGETDIQFERVDHFDVSPADKRRFITNDCLSAGNV